MSQSLERGQLLLSQARYQQAIEEFMRLLPGDPDNPWIHILLAQALAEEKRGQDAMQAAQQAIRLAPEMSVSHYVLGLVLFKQDKAKPALASLAEAIRLDPFDADNFGLQAAVYVELYQWEKALASADQALAVNPEHRLATNMRALALTKLHRPDAADETIRTALRRNPEDALTHANLGWSLLHQNRAREALVCFKQALRLNPQMDWARQGIVEALKARNPLYALMLRYFLWMGSFTPATQFALVIGAMFAMRLLSKVMQLSGWANVANGLVLAYLAFVLLTWLSQPAFNFLLRLHRDGRYALSALQTQVANWFGLGVLLATGMEIKLCQTPFAPDKLWMLITPYFLLIPVVVAAVARPLWPRFGLIIYLAVALAFGIAGLMGATGLYNLFITLCVIATWFGSFVPKAHES